MSSVALPSDVANGKPTLDTHSDAASTETATNFGSQYAHEESPLGMSPTRSSAASSGDSSVPRRIIRAIPDLRMFKFMRKMSYEQKVTLARNERINAEDDQRIREADERQRNKQKRPKLTTLPEISALKALPTESEGVGYAMSPLKEITGFIKSFGGKPCPSSRQGSSNRRSSTARRGSSVSNISVAKSNSRSSSKASAFFTETSVRPIPPTEAVHVRVANPTVLPEALSLPTSPSPPKSPRPKLSRMTMTPFRRSSEYDYEDNGGWMLSRKDSYAGSGQASAGTAGSGGKGGESGSQTPSPSCQSTRRRSNRKRRFRTDPETTDAGGFDNHLGTRMQVTNLDEHEAMLVNDRVDSISSTRPMLSKGVQGPPLPITPPHARRRRGKFRGYFFEHSTPDESEDCSPLSEDPILRKPVNDPPGPISRQNTTKKDWYQVRLDNILDDDPDTGSGGFDGKDIPEHLPTSPLCPRHPKHPSLGLGKCPFHGKQRVRTRAQTLDFV